MRVIIDLGDIFEIASEERKSLILAFIHEFIESCSECEVFVALPVSETELEEKEIEFLDELEEVTGIDRIIGVSTCDEERLFSEGALLSRGPDVVLSLFSGLKGRSWIKGNVLWSVPVVKLWEAGLKDYTPSSFVSFNNRDNFYYICPSYFSANLLKEKLLNEFSFEEEKIKILMPSLRVLYEEVKKENIREELINLFDGKRRIILVGMPWELRENDFTRSINFLIKGFSEVKEELSQYEIFVLTPKFLEKIDGPLDLGFKKQSCEFKFLKGLSQEERLFLYKNVEFLIYISSGEAFPYTLFEAISAGALCLVNDFGAVSEILSFEELRFENESSEDFVKKIKVLLSKDNLNNFRNKVKQTLRFYNFKDWVKEIADYLKEVFERYKSKKTFYLSFRRKPSLAYVSPLPPEKSGTATYSKELLPYLEKYYNIYLIVNQPEVDPFLEKRFELLSIEEFQKKAKYFDRILYHAGNSPYHRDLPELIERAPGVVVLHDFYLSGLYCWMDFSGFRRGIFFRELIRTYGLKPASFLMEDIDKVVKEYPFNQSIVNLSLGVIVHSNFAKNYFKSFYPQVNFNKIKVIPHLRKPKEILEGESKYICHLGFINKLKCCREIIEAFINANIPEDWKLIFVGAFAEDVEYEKEIRNLIRSLDKNKRIEITGYLRDSEYVKYIKKGTLFIQLRSETRGETSGAVLDLMSYGKPVIVNKIGWFEELPDDVVYKISEKFRVEDIKNAIENLINSEEKRKNIGRRAYEYIKKNHTPEEVARRYYCCLEEIYETNEEINLIREVSFYKGNFSKEKLAKTFFEYLKPLVRLKKIYVDVTPTATKDAKTGIQRVVKFQLKYLLLNPPEGYKVCPVVLRKEEERGKRGWYLEYSWDFASSLIEDNLKEIISEAEEKGEVSLYEGDILYMPDLSDWYYRMVYEAYLDGFYKTLRMKGVKLIVFIHDMLPVKWPDYFAENMAEDHAKWVLTISKVCNKILTPSKSTMEDIMAFLNNYNSFRKGLKLDFLHYPIDIISNAPHYNEITLKEKEILEKIKKRKYFLMVSTLEPRKGHEDILNAFEILWNQGFEYNLVFVGKEGWKVEKLIQRIKNHSEFNQRLFWLGYVSDSMLEELYENAIAVIGASKDEGFGLFIAEAATKGTPVIARDIKVFREIGGEYIYYFRNTENPEYIAEDFKKWIELYKEDLHPKIDSSKFLSWDKYGKLFVSKLLE